MNHFEYRRKGSAELGAAPGQVGPFGHREPEPWDEHTTADRLAEIERDGAAGRNRVAEFAPSR